jgi:hypothetical protein
MSSATLHSNNKEKKSPRPAAPSSRGNFPGAQSGGSHFGSVSGSATAQRSGRSTGDQPTAVLSTGTPGSHRTGNRL